MDCERCHAKTTASVVSYFNTQEICMVCKDKEQAHSLYKLAKQMDESACSDGNFNFPGIGLPPELK